MNMENKEFALKHFEECLENNDINAIITPCLVLNRNHLSNMFKDEKIEDINITHFKGFPRKHEISDLVIFVDDNGKTRIFKNRFGDDGFVNDYSDEKVKRIAMVAFKDGFDSATESLKSANELVQNK